MILHRDKRRELVRDCIVLHGLELIGVTARHADVPRVPGLDDVVQGLHGFGDGCVIVEPVALEDVDVVELEALEGVFD